MQLTPSGAYIVVRFSPFSHGTEEKPDRKRLSVALDHQRQQQTGCAEGVKNSQKDGRERSSMVVVGGWHNLIELYTQSKRGWPVGMVSVCAK